MRKNLNLFRKNRDLHYDIQHDVELSNEQRLDAALQALVTRGRALKLAFILNGLLVVLLLVALQVFGGVEGRIETNERSIALNQIERRVYQAETRVLLCDLSVDDVQMLDVEDRQTVEELCEGYQTLPAGLITENTRDKYGRLPN